MKNIDQNEKLEGKSATEIAEKLDLPYHFISETLHEIEEDINTYGDLIRLLLTEYTEQVFKYKKVGPDGIISS